MSEGKRDKYAAAGVDISAKDRFIARIGPVVERTRDARVLGGLGHFGGFLSVAELKDYDDPVLVGCTDGVGTKIKLALALGPVGLRSVGVDLVAMCVNDLVACGAKPLYFLDYYAAATLEVESAAAFVEGVAAGCEQAGCPLIGGETAQMPGLYTPPDFDAAGFCTGVVERAGILGPEKVQAGSVLIGLPSSGFHSNGFSLVRKHISEPTEALLAPTRIYVKPVLALREALGEALGGAAHITGGGLDENIPRMLGAGLRARVDVATWDLPAVMAPVVEAAELSPRELYATFNGGLGFVVAVRPEAVDQALASLTKSGEQPRVVGAIESCEDGPALILHRNGSEL